MRSDVKKMNKPNSPRKYFPNIKPEHAAEDYIVSKQVNRLDKFHAEFDVIRQYDPQLNLAQLRHKLSQTERKLRKKRDDLTGVRMNLDKQWQDLDEKEKSLRENFRHFNTFVRENMEKRERAEKKMNEDIQLADQRQTMIDDSKDNLAEIQDVKMFMDGKIKAYRLYEDFLQSVVDETPEFPSIPELINRYISLLNAKNSLAKLQEYNLTALEYARSDMMKLIEEKNFIIMGLNNQIANLQARYENANIKSLECEQLVLQIKNSAARQMHEIDEVKSTIWNVYVHMAQSKMHPVKIKKENVEEQMMYIKRTLTELAKVNQILRKQSKVNNKVVKKKS